MGLRNRLYVGGANFATGEGGYIAEIDATTGQVLRRFDPVDGDPDDGDFRFFELAFTRAGCKLAAADLLSFFAPGDPVLYEFTVCP